MGEYYPCCTVHFKMLAVFLLYTLIWVDSVWAQSLYSESYLFPLTFLFFFVCSHSLCLSFHQTWLPDWCWTTPLQSRCCGQVSMVLLHWRGVCLDMWGRWSVVTFSPNMWVWPVSENQLVIFEHEPNILSC